MFKLDRAGKIALLRALADGKLKRSSLSIVTTYDIGMSRAFMDNLADPLLSDDDFVMIDCDEVSLTPERRTQVKKWLKAGRLSNASLWAFFNEPIRVGDARETIRELEAEY